METCFNYTDRETGYFSSDERKYIAKIHRLKEQYSDKVRIIAEPENNDGCIYAEIPVSWFTVRVPKKLTLTEEQKSKLADRFKGSNKHN